MRNPSPVSVFAADIGRRDEAEYCSLKGGYVLEMQGYSPHSICVLRVWVPVMPESSNSFNAHIVKDWNMRCERWYNSRSEIEDIFESICSSEYSVEKFIENGCI